MQITVTLPDDAFETPKTPEEIERDLREGGAALWFERGEITAEQAATIAGDPPVPEGETLMDVLMSMPDVGDHAVFERRRVPPQDDGTLYPLLMKGPKVGDDADFERPVDYGRPIPELDAPTEATSASPEPTLHDLLILGPNVGEDADFARPVRPRRPDIEWDD